MNSKIQLLASIVREIEETADKLNKLISQRNNLEIDIVNLFTLDNDEINVFKINDKEVLLIHLDQNNIIDITISELRNF